MSVSSSAPGVCAWLTKEEKQKIRRCEGFIDNQYDPPKLFKLSRVGSPREMEQGEVILGKVKLVTTQRIACQLVYVEFKGVAKADFHVPSTTMIDEIQHYHKEWEFFVHKIPVFMHENRGYNFLEPGIYKFYFKARIPIGGPCSYSTDIASVSYRVTGVLVRNDVTQDILTDNNLLYYVRGYKDINPYDGARIGVWQERTNYVGGFLGLFQGQVKIRVKTDRRAYIPGEKIHIIGEIQNTTWRKCTFQYDLVQRSQVWGEHYFWRSDEWFSRFLKDKLIMAKGQEKVLHSGQRIELKEVLHIPKRIEPSYLGMTAAAYINDIINLEYMLRFQISVPYATHVRLDMPIIIGTEPFMFLPNRPNYSETLRMDPTKIKIPETPTPSGLMAEQPSAAEEDGQEERIKVSILDYGTDEPLQLPKFHPLQPEFQKRFPKSYTKANKEPETVKLFSKQPDQGGGSVRKLRKDGERHSSKCKCKNSKHKNRKRRHRSKCRKHPQNAEEKTTDKTFDYATYSERKRVTTRHPNGIPVEDNTFTNWLASVTSQQTNDNPGRAADLFIAQMKRRGVISYTNF